MVRKGLEGKQKNFNLNNMNTHFFFFFLLLYNFQGGRHHNFFPLDKILLESVEFTYYNYSCAVI
jgi:hypothetical protein